MEKVNQAPLFDPQAAQYVLGSIMHQPSLLYDNDKYILTVDDFNNKIYVILFGAIYNLSYNGAEHITPPNIDLYLSGYQTQHDTYVNANGGELCQLVYELTEDFDMAQFNYYYERIKKFSTLRELKNKGFDISEFYNPDFLNSDEEERKFNKLTINDILSRIRNKIQLIENHNVTKQEATGQYASKGIRDLVDSLKMQPEVGIPMEGKYLNYATRGCRKGKMYMYSAPSGGGKALTNDTLIPMYDGNFKRVGDVTIGDKLIDRTGKATKVLQIFPQGKKDVYRVTFKDGRQVLCNDEHLWTYRKETQRKGASWYTNTLKHIIDEGQSRRYKTNDGGWMYLVPMNEPVEYQERQYSIDPYALGLMIGDGSFRTNPSNSIFTYSSNDIELVESLAKLLNKKYSKNSQFTYGYSFYDETGILHVPELLKDYPDLIDTYSQDKFIPEEYLYGSIKQRYDLLAGLMDTDGSVDEKGRCSFSTVGKQLALDVQQLCWSLGMKVSIREDIRPDKYTTDICYDVTIMCRPQQKRLIFKLARKLDRVNRYLEKTKRFESNEYNAIVNIEKLNEQAEMTCFYVDNDEHLFLANDFVVTHNTRTMVGNACSIAYPRIEMGKVVMPAVLQPVLFIVTEMQADEIQTLILSWISGVNEEKILLNTYTEDEERLVNIAINIMEKYEKNFIIESIPNPNVQSLKSMITNYILHDNIEYIFYDYIFTSVALMDEFKQVGLREDVVLMMLSNTLKEVAANYNVFVLTASQLNGDWGKSHIRNANTLRGAKSLADKIDCGIIGVRADEEELSKVEEYCKESGLRTPNIVMDIYKNRRGKLCDVKIFRWFDYGTCRAQDIVVTEQQNYKILFDVPVLEYTQEYHDIKEYEH